MGIIKSFNRKVKTEGIEKLEESWNKCSKILRVYIITKIIRRIK